MQEKQIPDITESLKKLALIVYYFTIFFGAATLIWDSVFISLNSKIYTLNVISILVLGISLYLHITKRLKPSTNYGLIGYVLLLNIFLTIIININNPQISSIFLRDSITILILTPLISTFSGKINSIIIGLLYLSLFSYIAYTSKISFLLESLGGSIFIIGGYCVSIYFLISIVSKGVVNQEVLNKQISMQNQELTMQTNYLNDINKMLNEQTTEIRSQQKELQKLNSNKDKFLSILAHDLKTPMNSILGFSEILSNQFMALSEEKKLKYIKIIRKSAKNTYDLLENLLEWSRTQSNYITFIPGKISIEEVISEAIDLLTSVAEQKEINLVSDLNENFMIFADKNMIVTVLRNLISNAIKYSNPKSEVKISIEQRNEKIAISVIDKGVGMTKEQVDNLFKIDKSESTIGTSGEMGTGLGLFICNDFIHKHNSQLQVSSSSDTGTTFSFELQLADK